MSNVIESAISWAIAIANDDSHGYSQDGNKRWGNPDYDCSSFVITAFRQAGIPLNSTFTGDMKQDFLNHGFKQVNVRDRQRGDVLLNESRHTALYIGEGRMVHASSSETGGKYGKDGDQTGREICIRSYYDYPWTTCLRYVGGEAKTESNTAVDTSKGDVKVMVEVRQLSYGSRGADVKTLQILLNDKAKSMHLVADGIFGNNTKSVVADFQRNNGLVVDSIVGKNTWNALINR